MRKLGYGEHYRYPHDYEGALVEQDYLPEALKDRRYYEPSNRGYEARIGDYLDGAQRPSATLAELQGRSEHSDLTSAIEASE